MLTKPPQLVSRTELVTTACNPNLSSQVVSGARRSLAAKAGFPAHSRVFESRPPAPLDILKNSTGPDHCGTSRAGVALTRLIWAWVRPKRVLGGRSGKVLQTVAKAQARSRGTSREPGQHVEREVLRSGRRSAAAPSGSGSRGCTHGRETRDLTRLRNRKRPRAAHPAGSPSATTLVFSAFRSPTEAHSPVGS